MHASIGTGGIQEETPGHVTAGKIGRIEAARRQEDRRTQTPTDGTHEDVAAVEKRPLQ